jgi:hypothetical protein
MLFPKYVLEDLSVGSGSIIGKSNIEEFFNHISMHKDCNIPGCEARNRENTEVCIAFMHRKSGKFSRF